MDLTAADLATLALLDFDPSTDPDCARTPQRQGDIIVTPANDVRDGQPIPAEGVVVAGGDNAHRVTGPGYITRVGTDWHLTVPTGCTVTLLHLGATAHHRPLVIEQGSWILRQSQPLLADPDGEPWTRD